MEVENIQDRITYCQNEYEAMEGCDGLVIITEWNQFRNLNLDRVKELLKQPYFFDLRNIIEERLWKPGFHYTGMGQGVETELSQRKLGYG